MTEQRPEDNAATTPEAANALPEPEAAAIPDEPAPAPEKRRWNTDLWPFPALLVLALALVGTAPFWAPSVASVLPWGPRQDSEVLAGEIAALKERLGAAAQRDATLEQRLARLEQQQGGAQQAADQASLRDLTERVTALEQRPEKPPAIDATALAGLQGDVQRLDRSVAEQGDRLAKLEARPDRSSEHTDQALLLAAVRLRAALAGSRPFAAELGAIEALGKGRPEIRQAVLPLAADADRGIPSLAVLTERFTEEVAPALLKAEAVPPNADWGERLLGKLRSLVIVRHIGNGATGAAKSPAEAAVAHAEAALRANDLAGAVKAVEALPQPATASAQSWLSEAHRRLAAEQAAAQLEDGLAAKLAGSGGEGH